MACCRCGSEATASALSCCFGVHAPLQDLRAPELWFPVARQQQRRVCLSLGPPNSGKTRGALEALLGAPSGCYLGPLRLLVTEVYNELRKKGVRCSLITGPSKIIDPVRIVGA